MSKYKNNFRKIGIIVVNRSMSSVVDNRPHHLYEVFQEEVKKQGLTPVVLNLSKWLFDSKNPEAMIKNLENEYKIPNRNSEQKYNLAVIEQLSTRSNE
jgi:hypothetical protein